MDREVARTWTLYLETVLKGKSEQTKDDSFKGFVAGWACAYVFMWDLIMHPTTESHKKIVDLNKEMKEIQDAIEKKARGSKVQ